MDIFNEFATDENLEVEGRWVSYDDKTSFKIARIGNPAYGRLFSRLYKQNKFVLEGKGKAAEAASDKVMAEVYSKTILLDWKGPVSVKGEDLGAYSQAAAEKICLFKEFRKWVAGHADDVEAFKVAQETADAGN